MLRKSLYGILLMSCSLLGSCGIMDNGSCLSEDDDDGEKVAITFALSIDSHDSRSSRAAEGPTWGDPYTSDIGTMFDNRIRLNSLNAVLYDMNGNHVASVENMLYYSVSATMYQFVGKVVSTAGSMLSPGDYKIMIFANCPGVDIARPDDMTFSTDDISYPAGYIPMWGVKKVALTLTGQQDVGTIDLLRAAAKIEVTIDQEMVKEGYSLSDVSIDRYNTLGFCLPYGWNTVGETTDLSFMKETTPYCSRAYQSSSLVSEMYFSDDSGNGSKFLLYLPEYVNSSESAKISLTLMYDGKVFKRYPNELEFKNYTSGVADEMDEYDIVRNHYYQFNITGVTLSGEITYVVCPWKEMNTEIEFN